MPGGRRAEPAGPLHDQGRLEAGDGVFMVGQQDITAAGAVIGGQREPFGVRRDLGHLAIGVGLLRVHPPLPGPLAVGRGADEQGPVHPDAVQAGHAFVEERVLHGVCPEGLTEADQPRPAAFRQALQPPFQRVQQRPVLLAGHPDAVQGQERRAQ